MGNFKDFFNGNHESQVKEVTLTEEDHFESVVGERVNSVNSFIAWLVLKEHIKPNVKYHSKRKPVSLFEMATNKKLLYISKKLPNIRLLAKEFNKLPKDS